MVGVPGRSRACGNCRKRHIRCDETRPNCNRCIKAKLDCDGYRDLTVIHYNGTRKAPSITTSTAPAPTPEQSQNVVDFQSLSWNKPFSPWLSILPDLDEVFKNYTQKRLLKGNESIHPAANLVSRSLADQCFLALATSYFGSEHNENRIIEQGLKRYGIALKKLHADLADADRRASYDILEAVILMTFFEFLMANKKSGWIAHALGMQRLLEVRGPESFQIMPDLAVFQISRPSIIFASLVLRKPTILAQPNWKVIPWASQKKELIHNVFDILADCPGLLAEKDKLLGDNYSISAANDFHEQVHDHLIQLQMWKDLWDATEQQCFTEMSPTIEPPLRTNAEGRQVEAWKTVYTFASVYHGNALAVYHGTHIVLLKLLHGLEGSEAGVNAPFEEYDAGIEICRSVEDHLLKMRRGEGSFFVLFSLRMSWEVLSKVEPAIGLWLESAIKRIEDGTNGRWGLAGYLLRLEES